MIKTLDEVLRKVSDLPQKTIAVAQAEDPDILEVAESSIEKKLAKFIFVGNKEKITKMIREGNYHHLESVEIIESESEFSCAQKVMELVKEKKADLPMKGLLPTATFLRAVLNKDNQMRTSKTITQVTVFDKVDDEGLIFVTDCAMHISPDLNTKKDIIENAVALCRKISCDCPKVAVLTAIETVNPDMPETIDAAVLSKMNDRGQIKNCIVDGPFALDNAISAVSAAHKKIHSEVAGRADILVVSDIRMGNVLHKAVTYIARKKVASVVMGTASPLIMTSRSDSIEDKLLSIALSSYLISLEQLT